MIDSDQRLVVFGENDTTGVPWYHPAFETIQETPYTFHTPEEFSCRPNRGGDRGAALPDQPLDRDDAHPEALERRDRQRPRLPARPRPAVPEGARQAAQHPRRRLRDDRRRGGRGRRAERPRTGRKDAPVNGLLRGLARQPRLSFRRPPPSGRPTRAGSPSSTGGRLAGWKAAESPASFRVVDGAIACDGPTGSPLLRRPGREGRLRELRGRRWR